MTSFFLSFFSFKYRIQLIGLNTKSPPFQQTFVPFHEKYNKIKKKRTFISNTRDDICVYTCMWLFYIFKGQ